MNSKNEIGAVFIIELKNRGIKEGYEWLYFYCYDFDCLKMDDESSIF